MILLRSCFGAVHNEWFAVDWLNEHTCQASKRDVL